MSVKTYDPKEVVVVIGGVPISGYADGTFINLERTEDAFAPVAGADGEVSRAKSNNRMGSLTLTLMQTSNSNDVLSGIAALDEASSVGVVPVLVKDNSGRSIHSAPNSWIRKTPSAEFGKEISNREWVLDLADYIPFNGGTADFEPST